MQIAAEIRMGNVKSPRSVKMSHFKIKFVREKKSVSAEMTGISKEQMHRMNKGRWLAAVGMAATPNPTTSTTNGSAENHQHYDSPSSPQKNMRAPRGRKRPSHYG